MFHAIGAPESALAGFREGQAGGQAGRDAAVAWWVLSQVQWLLLFAAVPATAAALCRAFARDDPNFAEMWVFALYVAGQSLLLGAVWMLLEHWTAWGGFVLLLAAPPK